MELHPFYQQQELSEFCQSKDIHVTAYSSLGTTVSSGDNPLLSCAEVREVAKGCGATPAQVLLRWALDWGHSILPKSINTKHIAENAMVMEFDLGEENRKKLDDLGKKNMKFAWDPSSVA